MSQQEHDITNLLKAWRAGDDESLRLLMARVYEHMRGLAHRELQQAWGPTGIETTELVQRAFADLAEQDQIDWQDRDHFFRVTARAMRRVLIEDARQRMQLKPELESQILDRQNTSLFGQLTGQQILALDNALDVLSQEDDEAAQVFELRFFSGFSQAEIQRILNLSDRAVKAKSTFAKAWLLHRIKGV